MSSKTNKLYFGKRVSYYKRKEGSPQEVLTEKIGKKVTFVSRVEDPDTVRNVSIEMLFKVAKVLDSPPSKLLKDAYLHKKKYLGARLSLLGESLAPAFVVQKLYWVE